MEFKGLKKVNEGRFITRYDLDYETVTGLRLESRQKLNRIRPDNFGQASRISGVSPADVAALMVYLKMEAN